MGLNKKPFLLLTHTLQRRKFPLVASSKAKTVKGTPGFGCQPLGCSPAKTGIVAQSLSFLTWTRIIDKRCQKRFD